MRPQGSWRASWFAPAVPQKRFSANRRANASLRNETGERERSESRVQGPSPAQSGARERVLAVVPAVDDLLRRGERGEQVQGEPLAVGEADGWLLWFILRPACLVIAAPLAGLRDGALGEAVSRCNAFNAGMRWTVLSVAPWEGEQVATLSARVPIPPEDEGRWEAIGAAIEAGLREARPARGFFQGPGAGGREPPPA